MSLNLGPDAFQAIQKLKNSSDWRAFVGALGEQLNVYAHAALEVPPENRCDATGYARGLRDLLAHIEHVETGNRNPKPQIKSRLEAARV